MRIVIATVQVPFVRGGAEVLAEGLCAALREAGHAAEIVSIPFKWYPADRILDHMLACRLLDLTESWGEKIDLLIGLKFPAYLISHPRKVLWIVHQHRTAYDLWEPPFGDIIGAPDGAQIRDVIHQADRNAVAESKAVFTIAGNVSKRLKEHLGVDSVPLYTPPAHADQFHCQDAEDYFFFPSRITPLKRQALVVEALAQTSEPVRVRFGGMVDDVAYGQQLQTVTAQPALRDRVQWLGRLSEEDKRDQYARALGVIFPPIDEDYGYITLEAMLSSKPVITCTDSGGPLEFVREGETGLIIEPTAQKLAAAMDQLWRDRARARKLGAEGRVQIDRLGISWANVVRHLCG
jgi:glycosyltransferase involved in cell wall biosynthesis